MSTPLAISVSPACAFRLLGPFSLTRDGAAARPMWPKPTALLAMLLVADGPVPLDRIVAELWQGRAPSSAVANIRSYIRLLRRELGADAVRTMLGCYELVLRDARLDADTFRELLERADRTTAAEERAALLKEALDLWRGPALSGIPHGPVLESWVARMNGHRRRALLELAGLWLESGREARAQDLLRQHLLGQPTDETAYELLMRALHQAGDGSAALAVYQQANRHLVDRGLYPGPRLRGMQQAILSHRPLPAS
ncbi:AfsR/SARP family transcriptional regulator [Streptomyces litchfieldiae]|uniref:AfsR/SARP family transcriptional regulator n=1 Tax=Streptomyces litchfieldiae TaxID=3075543 RepID=A0ABU2MV77_9ACTN|nr:AfsR/SARP family transcriptional regulator [Streptomyces sp. DSM 44938]MDT0344999.1 AfsR/SARP family transcriptional regulator [Streptomyces sp. DSM 44938]